MHIHSGQGGSDSRVERDSGKLSEEAVGEKAQQRAGRGSRGRWEKIPESREHRSQSVSLWF